MTLGWLQWFFITIQYVPRGTTHKHVLVWSRWAQRLFPRSLLNEFLCFLWHIKESGCWAEGHWRQHCTAWMLKRCHSQYTAQYNMSLFESCVKQRSTVQQRQTPDQTSHQTSFWLFPFSSLCFLSTYLFQSQNTMFPENISLEYFTTCSLSHSSLTLCLHIIFIYLYQE